MYLVVEILDPITPRKGAKIVGNTILNRIWYAGRIVFSGTLEECEEEMLNY